MTTLACPQSQRSAVELRPAGQTETQAPAEPMPGEGKQGEGSAVPDERSGEFERAGTTATIGASDDGPDAKVDEQSKNERPERLDSMRADRDVFARYSPLVRRIALRSVRTLPRTLTVDDIVSAGWVGMAEAIRRRPDGMPEEQFEAYASYRIRGAILDYLRALDPLSRKLRNAARRITSATRALTQELGRAPRDEEIARKLEMPMAEYQQTLLDIQDAGFDRVEGVGPLEPQATSPSPEALATKSELVGSVAGAVEELPERLQIVLGLHYQQECSLREIGEILGVTESRVCQLHAEALQRLRMRLDGKALPSGRRRRSMSS